MKFFPESAPSQLKFDKIKFIVIDYGKNEYAKFKAKICTFTLGNNLRKAIVQIGINHITVSKWTL